ncbi:hypothetical protein V5799_004120, partial [Amblyomma americanum]
MLMADALPNYEVEALAILAESILPRIHERISSEEESDSEGDSVENQSESRSDERPDGNPRPAPLTGALELRTATSKLRSEPAAGDEPGSPALEVPESSSSTLRGPPQWYYSANSRSVELVLPPRALSGVDRAIVVAPQRHHTAPPMPLDLMETIVSATFSDSQIDLAALRLRAIKTEHRLAAAQGKALDMTAAMRVAAAIHMSDLEGGGSGDSEENSETPATSRHDEYREGDCVTDAAGCGNSEPSNG